jgi:hypothetical protein
MLINCPECHKKISSFAEYCVNCGIPRKNIAITTEMTNCDCNNGKIRVMGYEANCPKCKGSLHYEKTTVSIKGGN